MHSEQIIFIMPTTFVSCKLNFKDRLLIVLVHTVEVIFPVFHQTKQGVFLVNDFLELRLRFIQFAAEHIELTQDGCGSVTGSSSLVLFIVSFRQFRLDFAQFRFNQRNQFTWLSLRRVEFLFCFFQLMQINRNLLAKIQIQSVIKISTQETGFGNSLFFSFLHTFILFRNIGDVVNTLIGIIDSLIKILPLTYRYTVG